MNPRRANAYSTEKVEERTLDRTRSVYSPPWWLRHQGGFDDRPVKSVVLDRLVSTFRSTHTRCHVKARSVVPSQERDA